MANEENLIPFNKRTESEQREYAKKGGQKSGEARRKRKAFKEQFELLLSLPVKNEEYKVFMEQLGVEEDSMDNQMMLVMAMYSKAMRGDTKAFELIRDTIGEKPTEKVEGSFTYENSLKAVDGDEY